MEQAEYDTLLRRLAALVVKLDSTYDELVEGNRQQRAWNEQQQAFNAQQVEINVGVQTTLARVETLLARMIRHEPNGQDA